MLKQQFYFNILFNLCQQEILQPQATFYILTSNKTIVKTFYINSENALSH